MGVFFCPLFVVYIMKGVFSMSKIRLLLSAHNGRIYVYLATEDICRRFLQDAEDEGFLFGDGVKPTQKPSSDIIAVNRDMTLNYVGFVGHAAYQAADRIGEQKLIKVDYRKLCEAE